jgi:hypothetical protein
MSDIHYGERGRLDTVCGKSISYGIPETITSPRITANLKDVTCVVCAGRVHRWRADRLNA